MRQVVLDTETTGLEADKGHRIIEIGCVELVNRRRTGRTYHQYVNPERDIDPAAEEVHGISRDMLASKPRFAEIAGQLIEFLQGAELVIHNAEFDLGFLRHEFATTALVTASPLDGCSVVDTLLVARRLHPGQRNGLDALCKRYGVDNSGRDIHGALLDAQLLADVYLAMTGGQAKLSLDVQGETGASNTRNRPAARLDRTNLPLTVLRAGDDELAEHERVLDLLDRSCPKRSVWRLEEA